MKRKIIMLVSMAVMTATLLTGCISSDGQQTAESQEVTGSQDVAEAQETAKSKEAAEAQDETEVSEPETVPEAEEDSDVSEESEGTTAAPAATLEDGVYTAEFDTDSSMFHVSEACDGKGTLTVENGEMVIHVSLASKNIVNLFPGLAEDAREDGAKLLEPTTDSVTYSDGITEEVYGFDIPVPALEEEFDLALIGTKGTWYDHKVSVSNPEKVE